MGAEIELRGATVSEVLPLLSEAEGLATTGGEYLEVARAWLQLACDPGEARSCLQRGSSVAVDLYEHIWLAEAWYDWMEDQSEAQRLLEDGAAPDGVAEAHALAAAWLDLCSDASRARLVLEEVRGSGLEYTMDWCQLAEGWHQLLRDETRTRQLLAQAEQEARDADDWEELAQAWIKRFADTREHDRCLTRARELE